MARRGGLEDLYLTAYAFLSGAVHSCACDLEEHLEVHENGAAVALVNEPVLDGLDKLCLMIGETMASIARAVAPVFVLEGIEELEAHLVQLQRPFRDSAG